MNSKQKILLSILSGLLFIPAWYSCWGNGLLLFFAFIPLLFVEDTLVAKKQKSKSFFWLPFLAFFVWNLGATWWIKNASFAGLITALLVNTTMMTLPFWLFTITHRKLGNRIGYLSLIFFWIAMEYFYLNAEISWTWLNLGNGFANDIRLIQWFEYTGVLGGSFWILSINILLFKIIKSILAHKSFKQYRPDIIMAALLFIIPAAFSFIKFYSYKEVENPHEIVVVQPNIDPYQKFNNIPAAEQINILLNIADSLTGPETDYLVTPETYINNNIWLSQLEANPSIQKLRQFSKKYPDLKIIIGATTHKIYNSEGMSPTSRPFRENKYYDSFNSALQIDSSNYIPVYHKSQLVVGVEKMPYVQYLGFLKKLTLKLGGTFRSHGSQKYRDSFESIQDSTKVGPVICYESIFGEFVTEYVKDADANFLFVITNDGWWGNTPGYVQHNSFSALRAIENRRSIARSANTGISAFFNQRGETIDSIDWWHRSGIKATLNANNKKTFYTTYGDYFGRIASFLSIAIFLYTLVKIIIPNRQD